MKLIINTENAQDMAMVQNLLCKTQASADARSSASLQATTDMLIEDIKRRDAHIGVLMDAGTQQESKLAEARTELESLNVQLAEAAVAHRKQLKELEKTAAATQETLLEREAALATTITKQGELEAQLATAQAELQNCLLLQKTLQQQVADSETTRGELSAKLDSALAQSIVLQTEIRTLREQNTALGQAKRDLKAQQEAQSATLACAQLTIEALTAEKQLAEAAHYELHSKVVAMQSSRQNHQNHLLQLVQRVLASYTPLANDLSLDGSLALQQAALTCLQTPPASLPDAEMAPEAEALRKELEELNLLDVAPSIATIVNETESGRVLSLLADIRRIALVGELKEDAVLAPMNEVPVAADAAFGENHLAKQEALADSSVEDGPIAALDEEELVLETASLSEMNGTEPLSTPVATTVFAETEKTEARPGVDQIPFTEEEDSAGVTHAVDMDSFIDESCDLAELVSKVISGFSDSEPSGKKIVLSTEGPAIVRGYSEMLEPVVKTLVRNALASVKAKGKIEVKLSEEEDFCLLHIIDAGTIIGSPENIFDSDEAPAHAPTRSGLHTVREIVEMQSGIAGLSVTKTKNNFFIKLPKHS